MREIFLSLILLLLVFTSQTGAESAHNLVASGNELYKAGKITEALESYDRALELMPDSPEILLNKGNAHFLNGEFEKARDAYGRAALLSGIGALKAKAHFNFASAANREALRDSGKSRQQSLNLLFLGVVHYKEAMRLDSGYRSEAGRGIERARLSILQIRESILADSAGLTDQAADGSQSRAASAEYALGEPSPESTVPEETGVQGKPSYAGGLNSQSTDSTLNFEAPEELDETPADIVQEGAENSGKLLRSSFILNTTGKNW